MLGWLVMGAVLGELVALQGRVCWWRSDIFWEAHSGGAGVCAVSCLL